MTENIASVSVVIPMFNSTATIERALESVAAQSLLPQEVIVVDDDSSDMSAIIVEQWSKSNFPVKLIRHSQNLGPSASRNTGWNMAAGAYVAFLDADDSWDPRKIEIQYAWMAGSPNVALCGTLHSIDNSKPQSLVSSLQVIPTRRFTIRDLLIKNRFSTPSVMVKRGISERFDSTFRYSEDYLLWLTIASRHQSIYRIELPLTVLYKKTYGQGGLGSDLVPMLRGELRAFRSLAKLTSMTRGKTVLAMAWSILKFIQRAPRALCRGYLRRLQSKASIRA
jgi:glycosyltransferase involved in cell wall biosynthesis